MASRKDGGREPIGVPAMLGTEFANGTPSFLSFLRVSRCYELAAYAIAFGNAGPGAALVHGSIDGGTELGRFGHAWVLLVGNRLWEPIYAKTYNKDEWLAWVDARSEKVYDRNTVRRHIASSGHYGPWHDAAEFRQVGERERAEGAIDIADRGVWKR